MYGRTEKRGLRTPRIAGVVIAGFSLLLVGCGGGDSGGSARTLFVGDPHPDQAVMSALETNTDLHYDAAEIDGLPDAVALTGECAAETATQLTAQLQEYVRAGVPVVLVDATHDNANDLDDALGLGGAGHNDGLRAHWRSARLDSEGNTYWAHFFVSTPESDEDDDQAHHNFTDALRSQSYTNSFAHLNEWLGSRPASQPRGIDRTFVSENAERGPVAVDLDAVTSGTITSDDYTTLSEIENTNYSQTIWDTYYDSDEDSTESCEETSSDSCFTKASEWPYGRYTITTYAYTIYDYDTETDYWMFVVDGSLAQSNAYTESENKERAWFASKYQFENALMYYGSSSCSDIYGYSSSGTEIDICADGCSSSPSGSDPVLTESGGSRCSIVVRRRRRTVRSKPRPRRPTIRFPAKSVLAPACRAASTSATRPPTRPRTFASTTTPVPTNTTSPR